MSDQKHTPEPWKCFGNNVSAFAGDDSITICLTVQNHNPNYYCDQEANSRRIVACVNACEGLSQDALDGGWTAKGISDYAKELEAQRDELLLALKAAETVVRNCGFPKGASAIYELIAKIESESQK